MTKVLVGGTQSSGTTLMLAVLHKLGGDTGFTNEQVDKVLAGDADRNTGKGLEYFRDFPDKCPASPEIVKEACWNTDNGRKYNVTRHATIDTGYIILCIRNFDSTVKSVRNFQGMKRGNQPAYSEAVITADLLGQSYELLLDASRIDGTKICIVEFPRFAIDPEYLHYKLVDLISHPEIRLNLLPQVSQINDVLKETVQRDRIHY